MCWGSCSARAPRAQCISASTKIPRSWCLISFCSRTFVLSRRPRARPQVAIKMIKRSQKSRVHDSVFQREVCSLAWTFLGACALTFPQVNALKQLSHNNLLRLESIFRDDEHDCM